jgi:hypothetical protein
MKVGLVDPSLVLGAIPECPFRPAVNEEKAHGPISREIVNDTIDSDLSIVDTRHYDTRRICCLWGKPDSR